MRIALVGFGRWGRNHARILASKGWLKAVVDSNPVQLKACEQAYSGVDTHLELEQLRWGEIDGVILASPIESHVSQGLIVFRNRKHCLIEKPLAIDIADAELLGNAAREARCVLLTGHTLDYHSAANALLLLCRNGSIGSLRYWHSTRARLVPPRLYTSVVHELLWHDLALLLRLTGRLPGAAHGSGRLEMDGVLTLEFGHFYATLCGSQVQPLRESRIVVCGDDGALCFDDEQPWDGKLQVHWRGAPCRSIAIDSVEPLQREIEHFVEAMKGGRPPISGVAEAIEILELIELVQSTCSVFLRS